MATREQVMNALVALLGPVQISGAPAFNYVGRRNRAPATIAQFGSPALILVKHRERYERQGPNLPPTRYLEVVGFVYFTAGANQNAVPDTFLSNVMDAFDSALAPDRPQAGFNTLGGLVYSCLISGDVEMAPGDQSGIGLAIVPFEICLP
jgi:hypothetical protein